MKVPMEIICPECDKYVRFWSHLADGNVEYTCDNGHHTVTDPSYVDFLGIGNRIEGSRQMASGFDARRATE